MRLNADFDQQALVHSEQIDWVPSPMPGVDRRMLDRVGEEVARATSIVRYAPGSAFSAHTHDGGEEFYVLDGVFQDEHGDYPAGTYVRNPPGTSHTPASEQGCIILVKLWQFDPADRANTRINTHHMEAIADTTRPGVSIKPLFADTRENVRVEHWEPEIQSSIQTKGGAELFVLEGSLTYKDQPLARGSWLRLPPQASGTLQIGGDGAKIWVKTGHLAEVVRAG
ncbi:MAG: cupin domain-containing protein [Alphaproteobacteria bacterium]